MIALILCIASFYHATLCEHGTCICCSRVCLSIHLSVHLSVTSQCPTEMAKCSITQTMPRRNPGILVF